jgi:hypothetical protein
LQSGMLAPASRAFKKCDARKSDRFVKRFFGVRMRPVYHETPAGDASPRRVQRKSRTRISKGIARLDHAHACAAAPSTRTGRSYMDFRCTRGSSAAVSGDDRRRDRRDRTRARWTLGRVAPPARQRAVGAGGSGRHNDRGNFVAAYFRASCAEHRLQCRGHRSGSRRGPSSSGVPFRSLVPPVSVQIRPSIRAHAEESGAG